MVNLRARRIRTQSQVFRRIGIMGVGFVTLATMLMTFPNVRHVGVSLFASAGVAGLVAGLAARPVLTNLIAGVQIALTEPIRIDDVVIVEGEWGRIEEIAMTYVVVRIWDLRRLVVPLSYFIEKPFQNWTRATADLLGTVYIYTDYCVPVDEVRKELRRILETSGMWDGRVCVLQVTNSTDRAVELRALMSAPNSGTAWDLRCYVRERLIQFVREHYPESLPRTRAEVQGTFRSDASGGNAAVLAAAARG
jgi:small-conductance mechanosensitive channel